MIFEAKFDIIRVGSTFDRELIGLSSDSLIQFGVLDVAHSDPSRTLCECNLNDCSVQIIDVEVEIPLANHYHKLKDETFVLVEGGGVFYGVAVDEYGNRLGEVQARQLLEGAIIKVPAFFAHTFILRPGSRLVCFSSKPFNPENTDLHPLQLV